MEQALQRIASQRHVASTALNERPADSATTPALQHTAIYCHRMQRYAALNALSHAVPPATLEVFALALRFVAQRELGPYVFASSSEIFALTAGSGPAGGSIGEEVPTKQKAHQSFCSKFASLLCCAGSGAPRGDGRAAHRRSLRASFFFCGAPLTRSHFKLRKQLAAQDFCDAV